MKYPSQVYVLEHNEPSYLDCIYDFAKILTVSLILTGLVNLISPVKEKKTVIRDCEPVTENPVTNFSVNDKENPLTGKSVNDTRINKTIPTISRKQGQNFLLTEIHND